MKKYINLLTTKKDYKEKEQFFLILRKISFVLIFFTFILLITILLFQQKINSQYQKLLLEKENYLQQLLSKKEIEKKVIYINEKGVTFNKILKEDVDFLPYYQTLIDYFPASSQSATIKSISFNNKKEVKIVVNFINEQELYQFLDHLEEDKFLNLFSNLFLNSFNLSEKEKKFYQLILEGQFKPLKNVN